MTEKRFTITQNGDNFTVRDNLKKRHMGMFEFKQDEFPVYFCFHKIIDLLNEQHEEIQQLQRHIKRSTFNKIRVEDVFNCAKYDRFYDNEEAIKSIDWIAKALGVDFE